MAVEPLKPMADGGADAPPPVVGFLTIRELPRKSRAAKMRLRQGDVVLAVDSEVLRISEVELRDLLSDTDFDQWLLTIWRDGVIFHVFTNGPLNCALGYADPATCDKIADTLKTQRLPNPDTLLTFEVYRDLSRHCEAQDMTPSMVAVVFPLAWLFERRLWEPLGAVFVAYALTFAVHIVAFLVTYILVSLYMRRAQIALVRSFMMYRDKTLWVMMAATDERMVQRICLELDPKAQFAFGQKPPPPAPKKKKSYKISAAVDALDDAP
jgi:hypothetical protein